MFSLKNKVALITGARRGIGRGIAEAFAKVGANVIISDIDLGDCERTVKEIEERYNVRGLAIKCDVSDQEEVNEMVNAAIKEFKKIDILVNNAGIFFSKTFLEYSEDDWNKMINTNLKSIYLCSQAVAKHMIKKNHGKIINIASIAGIVGYIGGSAYCASKGGMITLTKELALELAQYKINVNAIAPGVIETPMTKFLTENKKLFEQTLAGVPLKRIGKPEDIGHAAVYLASNESDYVTGNVLVVDGGWIIQ